MVSNTVVLRSPQLWQIKMADRHNSKFIAKKHIKFLKISQQMANGLDHIDLRYGRQFKAPCDRPFQIFNTYIYCQFFNRNIPNQNTSHRIAFLPKFEALT
jgi:hypothetical protein